MTDQDKTFGEEKSSDELRAEIARTRERLAEEVEALGQKLSPENVKREAREAISREVQETTERVREGVRHVRDNLSEGLYTARTSVVEAARTNPMPMALIGVGMGWLLWNSVSNRRARTHVDYGYEGERGLYGYGYGYEGERGLYGYERERGMSGQVRERAGELTSRAHEVADVARERVHELTDRARHGAESLTHSARDTAREMRDRASYLGARARERAGYLGSRARDRALWMRHEADHIMHENPLLFGALAIAAGIGIGMMLPRTRSEARLLGQYGERFVDRVKDTAHDATELATQAARRAAESVRETVSSGTERMMPSMAQSGQAQAGASNVSVQEVKPVGGTATPSASIGPYSQGHNGRPL